MINMHIFHAITEKNTEEIRTYGTSGEKVLNDFGIKYGIQKERLEELSGQELMRLMCTLEGILSWNGELLMYGEEENLNFIW